MADVMGLVIGCLVVGGIGFVVGRYGNTPTQEKLAELQRRIDVLTIENEDLTTSRENLLAQKDIWKKTWNKTADLVKKQAQTIKDSEVKLQGYEKMVDDLKAKLVTSNNKLDKYEERWLVTSPHWKKLIDKKVRDEKGAH